jgi:hypothetical protein
MMSGVMVARFVMMAAGIFLAGPLIAFFLRPTIVRAWFEGGPEMVESPSLPQHRTVVAELKRLGFEALGVRAEKAPFRAAVRDLSFVSGDRRCYASVASAYVPRLYFYTPFAEGGFVLTSNSSFPRIDAPVVQQTSHAGCKPERLLQLHQGKLDSLGRWGSVLPTAEARTEATYQYYRTPEVRRALRRIGVLMLVGLGLVGWVLFR